MIRLLFIVVAFLLMLGAVIGGLYFWGIDPLARLEAMMGIGPPADPAAESAVGSKKPAYVDFGLLMVPIIQDRELKGRAEMIVRLQVSDDNKVRVAQELPRLQHAYLQDMLGFLPLHLRESGDVRTAVISQRLVRVAEKTIGPGMVVDVVIEQISVK